ncbi:DUF3108 domain-containing protein [Thiolapillus sp.]
MNIDSALFRVLAALALLLGCSRAGAEILRYEASYQGVFSANKHLPIAAVRLDNKTIQVPALGAVTQLAMEVSSEPYPFVEEHFPFRVRYRSMFLPEKQHVLALEKYEKTVRVKHEIDWVDTEQRKLLRFRQQGKNAGERPFPALLQRWLEPGEPFEFHKYVRHGFEDGLLDWLSMLEVIRQRPIEKGREFSFSVTDGKHLYHYRVRVQNRRLIEVGGRKRQAWKLRFDAVEEGERGAAHRPLYVWLADDAQRTPLLFENRHPLGRFLVSLSAVQ